jgi:trigger factor
MEVKQEKMPVPVKFVISVEAAELTKKKIEIYDKIKDEIEVTGFRKGHVPREVAETKGDTNRLYKPIIDELYNQVAEQHNIVSSRDFKFFGDFKKEAPLTMEFVAELKPEVGNVPVDDVKGTIKIEDATVTEDDINDRVTFELKQKEKILETDKQVCENLDVAIIDFEGKLVGEDKPFKGGAAKSYQIRVNDLVNGKKQFIDTFEDQLVGMKIGETKDVKVKFPDDYKDTTKSGKDAIFVVTLKALKQKIVPVLNEEFVKTEGSSSIDEYKEALKKKVSEEKSKRVLEDYKKRLISEIVKQSDVSPIPENMISQENEREWRAFLRRISKTEEQFTKENANYKTHFFDTNSPRSREILKTTLVLEKIAKDASITVSEEEIVSYVMKVSDRLQHDEKRKEKILVELNSNKYQYTLMEIAARNEKVIEFLIK